MITDDKKKKSDKTAVYLVLKFIYQWYSIESIFYRYMSISIKEKEKKQRLCRPRRNCTVWFGLPILFKWTCDLICMVSVHKYKENQKKKKLNKIWKINITVLRVLGLLFLFWYFQFPFGEWASFHLVCLACVRTHDVCLWCDFSSFYLSYFWGRCVFMVLFWYKNQ